MKKLDLTSLRKALTSLEKAIHRHLQDRDSVIQRFEYSYELCWKMLSKELKMRTPSPTQSMSLDFNNLMREGARFGLIEDPEVWFEYRRMRNITSHTYDEKTAEQVSGAAKSFLENAKALLEALDKT